MFSYKCVNTFIWDGSRRLAIFIYILHLFLSSNPPPSTPPRSTLPPPHRPTFRHTTACTCLSFLSFFSNSARIARGRQVEPKEFPNTWRDDPESQAQANLTLNSFAHEIVDIDRIPNRVLDEDEQDYLIQEDAIKPTECFQSFHFHHASAGKSQERNDRLVSSYIWVYLYIYIYIYIYTTSLWKGSAYF